MHVLQVRSSLHLTLSLQKIVLTPMAIEGRKQFRVIGSEGYRRIYRKAKKDCGESMSAAIWSDFESIVLSEIVSSFPEPQQHATILRFCNDIVYYSTAPFCTFFLPDNVTFREKNYTQLHAKLQHVGSRQLQQDYSLY